MEGAKIIDLCIEGDKLLEQGTGAVYNKNVKGVKVSKGAFIMILEKKKNPWLKNIRRVIPDFYLSKQCGCTFFAFGVSPIQCVD